MGIERRGGFRLEAVVDVLLTLGGEGRLAMIWECLVSGRKRLGGLQGRLFEIEADEVNQVFGEASKMSGKRTKIGRQFALPQQGRKQQILSKRRTIIHIIRL